MFTVTRGIYHQSQVSVYTVYNDTLRVRLRIYVT